MRKVLLQYSLFKPEPLSVRCRDVHVESYKFELGIQTNVFIPPAWKLNDSSIRALEKLGFSLAEQQEEFLLLSHKPLNHRQLLKLLFQTKPPYRLSKKKEC